MKLEVILISKWPTPSPLPAAKRRGRPPVYGKTTKNPDTTTRNTDWPTRLPKARTSWIVPPDELSVAMAMDKYHEATLFINPFLSPDDDNGLLFGQWKIEARRVGYVDEPERVTVRHVSMKR
jgi:hypothetical protein